MRIYLYSLPVFTDILSVVNLLKILIAYVIFPKIPSFARKIFGTGGAAAPPAPPAHTPMPKTLVSNLLTYEVIKDK